MDYRNYYIDVPEEVDNSHWNTYGPVLTTGSDWTFSSTSYSYAVSISALWLGSHAEVSTHSIEIWNGKDFVAADRSFCILTASNPKTGILDTLSFSFKGRGIEADTPIRISATYGYEDVQVIPSRYSVELHWITNQNYQL